MKALGLVGGMSAESTVLYYQLLNRLARERLGGLHSARLIVWSFDFAPIAELQSQGAWDELGRRLVEAARRLEAAGAEAIVICANTMHLVADEVRSNLTVPLIHIGEATALAVKAAGARRPLLLGTRYTMEKPFYLDRLRAAGLEPLVPDDAGRSLLHGFIYDELCQGVVSDAARSATLQIIEAGRARGADLVIFGCTELGLLLAAHELSLPLVDTTEVHARAAAEFAFG